MIDLYSDPGHALFRQLVERAPGALAHLKTASFEPSGDGIPLTAFAWATERRYPVHTPEHAVVSYLYAKHADAVKTAAVGRGLPAGVLGDIKQALEMYGIAEADLAFMETKVAAISEEDCLFPDKKLYPVRDAGEVKLAEQALQSEYKKLTPLSRHRAFTKLSAAAMRHQVELHPASHRWAGETATNTADLADQLAARSVLAKTAEHAEAYRVLSDAVLADKAWLKNDDNRKKLAAHIDELDGQAKLRTEYDRRILDPVATVYNTNIKLAADDMDLGCGRVGRQHLMRLPPSFYGDALGDDVLPEIAPGGRLDPESLHAVLSTLPATNKLSFVQSLRSAGVPVAE